MGATSHGRQYERLVVGGGVSGLAHAWWLSGRGADVGLLEREPVVGSDETRRATEEGAHVSNARATLAIDPMSEAFLRWHDTVPEAPALSRVSEDARVVYLRRPSGLIPVPPTLTPLASWPPGSKTRWTMWRRALRKPRTSSDYAESLSEFVRRTYGRHAIDPWLRAFTGYRFGAPPHRVDAAATMAPWVTREHKRGALLDLESRIESNYSKGSYVPAGGLQTFLQCVARALPSRVHCDRHVERLYQMDTGDWIAETADGDSYSAPHVTLAINAREQSRLLRDADPFVADTLHALPYHEEISCSVVLDARDTEKLPRGREAWTAVIPRTRLAGIRFDHAIDPSVVPPDHGLLSIRLLPVPPPPADDALLDAIRHELCNVFACSLRPTRMSLHRDELAVPHYAVGHLERARPLAARLEARGLTLRGRHITGPGVEDRVRVDAPLRAGLPEGVVRV